MATRPVFMSILLEIYLSLVLRLPLPVSTARNVYRIITVLRVHHPTIRPRAYPADVQYMDAPNLASRMDPWRESASARKALPERNVIGALKVMEAIRIVKSAPVTLRAL